MPTEVTANSPVQDPIRNVSGTEDCALLFEQEQQAKGTQWQTWIQRADELSWEILSERNGEPLDLSTIIDAAKADPEERT